jgi:hypothetical protein
MTDLSVTRPDPDTRKERPWERRQREQQENAVAAMSIFERVARSQGEILDLIKAGPIADVLYSGARTIPASGVDRLEWPVPHAALTIANLSASLLTVGNSGGSAPPSVGAGVLRVNPGIQRTWNARGNGIAVSGLAGSTYDLTAYVRPRQPASGQCGTTTDAVLIPPGTTSSAVVNLAASSLSHVAVVLSVSAITGSIQLVINAITPSGYVYPLLNPLAVSSVSVTPYRIGPSLTPSPGAVANDLVPAILQVIATVTPAVTYGLDLVAG